MMLGFIVVFSFLDVMVVAVLAAVAIVPVASNNVASDAGMCER